jgi:hypothetical protein
VRVLILRSDGKVTRYSHDQPAADTRILFFRDLPFVLVTNSCTKKVYEEMLHAQVIYYRGYNLDCYQSLKKLNVVYEKMDKLYAAIDATQEAISQQKRSLSFDSKVFRKTHSMLERLEAKLEEIEKLRPITC